MGVKYEKLSSENPHTVFLMYELGHIEELERFWDERPEERVSSFVIAFSLDIEAKLKERGIPFSSGRAYRQTPRNLLEKEDEMIAAFFSDQRWQAFKHRDIALLPTFQFMFRVYLQRAWYYSNLLISIIEIHPNVKRFMLFTPSGGIVSKVAGGLAEREINAVVDCAKAVGAAKGISVVVMPLSLSRASLVISARPFIFMTQRALFSIFLKIWNTTITLLRQPHRPRLVISDYWRNVGQCIEALKRGECIFLDRMEMRRIPWRMLVRYRMRFVHSENFLSRNMRRQAKKRAEEFAQSWIAMRATIAPVFACRGYSLDILFLNAIDDIISNFEKLICEIEGTYSMYEHVKPNVVLLRASVSGQMHFSVLPLVAKKLGIPSLELQHGLEYLGPGSLSRGHAAEHIAVYGSLVKKELLSVGHELEKVHNIGSPRFDDYFSNIINNGRKRSSQSFTVLCIAPNLSPIDGYDSYSAEDYFNAVARAVEPIQNVHVIIKLRPGPANEGLLRAICEDVFSRVSHTVVKSEPMPNLFMQADVVVSCYSTIILEALQFGVPIIIPALNPIEESIINFHFSFYKKAGALSIVYTEQELSKILFEFASSPALRDTARRNAFAFLVRAFCFDGNSSQRLMSLISTLAERSVFNELE